MKLIVKSYEDKLTRVYPVAMWQFSSYFDTPKEKLKFSFCINTSGD